MCVTAWPKAIPIVRPRNPGERLRRAAPTLINHLVSGGSTAMLINLAGRSIYYDLAGAENGQVVCFTHSLASDGGMWAEQLPPLLADGYRVLRLDMRGHGGSDPVAGDYTMEQLADDVA